MAGHDNADNISSSHTHFPFGTSVEVKTNEEGFKKVYFSGTVIPPPCAGKASKKIYVKYDTLLADESGSDPLREYVKVRFLRPVPPAEEIVEGFKPDDDVDAFYNDGWWIGVVAGVVEDSNKFIVSFNDLADDELEFKLRDLRPHWDWVDGNWVRPMSKARNQLDVGRRVEVSFDGEDAWFPATIQQGLENGDFVVEYCRAKDESMKANVDSLHVRPCPPLLKGKNYFILLGKVDAFFHFGWRSGVITKELENSRFLVFFDKMKEVSEFDQSALRPHMEWKDGKWLLSSDNGGQEGHRKPHQSFSPTTTSIIREAHSLLTIRRQYQADPGAALKNRKVGNVEGVVIPCSVDSIETSAKLLKIPKGYRSKRVGRNVKRTLPRVDQEEGPKEPAVLVEENPSSGQEGQNTCKNIAVEVPDSVVWKIMAVEKEVGEVPNNEEECPQESAGQLEENHSSGGEEEQNISGKIASVEIEDFVVGCFKEVEKDVYEVPNNEIYHEEPLSNCIEEMDYVSATDSPRPPPLKHCSMAVPQSLPFEKTTDLWETIESTEVFQKFPQNPHFQPLEEHNVGFREGLAIGLMVNFSNLVKTTSRLQVYDLKSTIYEKMETFPGLEKHGFDVSAVRECITELLLVKDREEKLLDEANNLKNRILVKCHEKARIEEEIREICEQMRKLQEKFSIVESGKGKLDEEIASLQAGFEETRRSINNGLKAKLPLF